MDSKLKIGNIEGSADAIRELIKAEDVDLVDLMNAKKSINIPLVWFAFFGFLFFVLCVLMLLIPNTSVKMVLLLASVIIGFVIIGMVYMQWKSKTLACIVSLGEAIVVALSLGIYTPKDVIKKAEDVIESKFEFKK